MLEDYRIRGLPSSAYYITNFINEEEESLLLEKIANAPKPRWKHLSRRRLQTWPSELNKDTLLEEPLPKWLIDPIISKLLSYQISESQGHIFADSPHGSPNHVLINEYLPGQGIMTHKDGAAYYPAVCTVSLGGSLCLDIYASNEDGTIRREPQGKILQEPRSLLITTDEIYTKYFHGIAETTEDADLDESTVSNWDLLEAPDRIIDGRNDREMRISLTYRDVIKISKLGAKIALFGKKNM